MATTIAPIINVATSPIVSVTGASGVSYDSINNSIGMSMFYKVNSIYQYTNNLQQLLSPVVLKKFDKVGNRQNTTLQMTIDPYQQQASLTQEMLGYNYAFDSNNGFFPFILANTTVNYQIKVTELTASQFLSGASNFDNIEFLQDYINDF
jgi:hypothetical protein